MTLEIIQEVMEMWTYCSPNMRKSLINGYIEITENGNPPAWMEFLADEFCLIELDRSNFYQSHG